MFKVDLRKLILLLALAAALLTFLNSFFASYQTQRDQLMEQTLDTNRVYAAKLADITQGFFVSTQDQLAYSAEVLSGNFGHAPLMNEEVRRLIEQSDSFNTVLIVGADGTALASSADTRGLVGKAIQSDGARQALQTRLPSISNPYVGANGRLVVMISHPIFDAERRYLGYVGGVIYLRSRNILHTLLGVHHYRDGSYLYVVDGRGTLIYHEHHQRVGENVSANPAVQALRQAQQGMARVVNTQGVDMLAGYAHVPASNWGIVAQRPTEVTLHHVDQLAWLTLRNAIPLTLLSLLILAWLSRRVAQPLRDLADMARELDAADAPARIEKVGGWYYEADRLKRGLLTGVTLLQQKLGRLSQENVTDPLTGLSNRRGLQVALDAWQVIGQPFSVAMLDADHFKRINDSFGHEVGDQVLAFLAQQMREGSRNSDVLCRSGGEEFLMLLPGTSLDEAQRVAQRLCDRIAATASPTGAPITVSIGVAHSPSHGADSTAVIRCADQALYAAKQAGRNQVVVASLPSS